MISSKFWARSDVAIWHRVGADERRTLCGARIGEGFTRSESEMDSTERCERCESVAVREIVSEETSPRFDLDALRHELRKVLSRASYAVENASAGDDAAKIHANRELERASDVFESFLNRAYLLVSA